MCLITNKVSQFIVEIFTELRHNYLHARTFLFEAAGKLPRVAPRSTIKNARYHTCSCTIPTLQNDQTFDNIADVASHAEPVDDINSKGTNLSSELIN